MTGTRMCQTQTALKNKFGTILLVDDDEALLKMLARVLESAGYRVLPCSNGRGALAASEEFPYPIDLLLSDVEMPGIDGRELGLSMKKLRPQMNVLLMSGLTGGDQFALADGWNFIQKPFMPRQLIEKILTVA